jgi:hypothetical protein
MEADWSVEVGSGQHSIDASWEGFVDLQTSPHAINAIEEAIQHSALREALLSLNAEDSSVFTAKCDVWALVQEEIDPDEFGASHEEARVGFASYIDILERDPARFASFQFHEQQLRDIVSRLRMLALPQSRVDFVLRSATVKEQNGYGFTLYAAGCGSNEADAYSAWQAVLAAVVAATIAAAAHPPRAGE